MFRFEGSVSGYLRVRVHCSMGVPGFDSEPGHLQVSDEWRIRIGRDPKDLISFRFGEV